MKTINDYLDAVAARHGLTSDYQLWKHLGVSKQRISNIRTGKSVGDIDLYWRIADTLNIDSREIEANIELQRAMRSDDPARARLWTRRIRDLSAALSIVFAGIFALQAAALPHVAAAWQCILC